jgi:protoporphyrin/coproporphyrin ferrochelatase
MRDAIVLVNMGGPARRRDVEPYLRAIFNDPAILSLPGIVRTPLANLIAMKRAGAVADRYDLIGGYTPLFHWSSRLRTEVRAALAHTVEVMYAFRYISPTIEETLTQLKQKGMARVGLLPLFPHYTHTMTGSVVKEARRVAAQLELQIDSGDDWGLDTDVLEIWSRYLMQAVAEAGPGTRVLFVAHGIPEAYVKRGDDYPTRVAATASALAQRLPNSVKWSLGYQSKVGPVKWTGPYLEAEIARFGRTRAPLVVMPLSFVADCLETLYDLDIIAKQQAEALGIPRYVRARTFNDDPDFVRVVVRLARESFARVA